MHWFTADPHYSHANIIRFCDRPFRDVAKMNARLLAECRARVGPDDDLWILGDFTAGRSIDMQRREVRGIYHALPGRRHLIRGNHDEDWVCDLPWDSVSETADIVVDKRRLFLCHYPMITWPGARHQGPQLYGHVHQNWQGSRNCVNVGVDVWGFRPVTLQDIDGGPRACRSMRIGIRSNRAALGPRRSAQVAAGSSIRPWSPGRPWCATGGSSWLERTRRSSSWERPCANGCRRAGASARNALAAICPSGRSHFRAGLFSMRRATAPFLRGNRMSLRDFSYKASVVERLLASIDLIDPTQACALLRIETDDPEGVMQAMARDDAVIALIQNGRIRLPLFQFDTANGRVFSVVRDILKLTPARVSNLRLCYWLTPAHADFGCAPTDRFGKDDAAVLAAFSRYIEPVRHG